MEYALGRMEEMENWEKRDEASPVPTHLVMKFKFED